MPEASMPKDARPAFAVLFISVFILPSPVMSRPSSQNSAVFKESKPNQANSSGEKLIVENSSVYEKWLDQDVAYIITSGERAAFLKLTTNEEREHFIEQFWLRRDPTPDTPKNEFKDEHFRRIAYANEHFGTSVPGWKSDRGRVYIVWGAPDAVQSLIGCDSADKIYGQEEAQPTTCDREEIWHYNYIDTLGPNRDVKFIHTSDSADYKLAANSAERNALLFSWSPGPAEPPTSFQPSADIELIVKPFETPPVKFKNLNELVSSPTKVDGPRFAYHADSLRATEYTDIVPITVRLSDQGLGFQDEQGRQTARANLTVQISTLGGREVETIEDRIVRINQDTPPDTRGAFSQYQLSALLNPGVYRMEFTIKDELTGKVSLASSSLHVPRFERSTQIEASGLILAEQIAEAPKPDRSLMDISSDAYKIWPRVGEAFTTSEELGAFLQVYDLKVAPESQNTEVSIDYRITRGHGGNEMVFESIDHRKVSSEQLTIHRFFPLLSLAPGAYTLTIKVTNENSHQAISRSNYFSVTAAKK
jgi:GWxTD domain-containing protein